MGVRSVFFVEQCLEDYLVFMSKAAMSNRNSLLSQKSRSYLNEGSTLNDLVKVLC